MLNRRTLRDDNKGVGEPLNELDSDGQGMRTRLKHYLVKSYRKARILQYLLDLKPITMLSKNQYELYKIDNRLPFGKNIDTDGKYIKFTWLSNYDHF